MPGLDADILFRAANTILAVASLAIAALIVVFAVCTAISSKIFRWE